MEVRKRDILPNLAEEIVSSPTTYRDYPQESAGATKTGDSTTLRSEMSGKKY